SKYGVGIGGVEKALASVGIKTKLTRMETLKLFSIYEKGFPYNSLERGEKLFINIKAAVGGNVEAMEGMMGTLQSIIEKFPELEDAITNVDEKGNRKLLESQSRLAFMSGKLTLQEHRRFMNYVNGNKQA